MEGNAEGLESVKSAEDAETGNKAGRGGEGGGKKEAELGGEVFFAAAAAATSAAFKDLDALWEGLEGERACLVLELGDAGGDDPSIEFEEEGTAEAALRALFGEGEVVSSPELWFGDEGGLLDSDGPDDGRLPLSTRRIFWTRFLMLTRAMASFSGCGCGGGR